MKGRTRIRRMERGVGYRRMEGRSRIRRMEGGVGYRRMEGEVGYYKNGGRVWI